VIKSRLHCEKIRQPADRLVGDTARSPRVADSQLSPTPPNGLAVPLAVDQLILGTPIPVESASIRRDNSPRRTRVKDPASLSEVMPARGSAISQHRSLARGIATVGSMPRER
jgi:hypothetical protein